MAVAEVLAPASRVLRSNAPALLRRRHRDAPRQHAGGPGAVEVTSSRTKMRVLIEMRSAGKVVGATRGHFKKAPHGGETVVPDGPACPDAPRGCAKFT